MFFESWFIVFPKGWLEGLSTISSKLYLWWLASLLACLLVGLLASLLASSIACLLPSWFACLHAKWLVALAYRHGWLACLLACPMLACLHACMLACWLAGLAGLAGLPGLAGWPACLPGLPACLLACWLHCERMIGEKNPRGRGTNTQEKMVRPIQAIEWEGNPIRDCQQDSSLYSGYMSR